MILNTGMRTDIPGFYSKWLLNRIEEGYVYVRNPYYRHQVTRYKIDNEVVDCLAFCTKNPPKNNSKRLQCNCLMGNDIGAYNTCMHLCKYCYANANQGLVRENIKKHNPNSPFLIGELEPEDKITEAVQKCWLEKSDNQISFI